MTHGPEKSDLVVVAVKPANKAEPSVAEPVEPRAGTNADQPSTRRAQNRGSVSQPLRITVFGTRGRRHLITAGIR
jgi:RNA-directed DNA polymerase